MTLKRVHWIVFQATLVLLFNLIVIHKSEALFLSIQNLGGDTIIGATFTFSVEPWCEGTPFTFQIVSSDSRIDPTNIYLQFDEAHPIGVGETYNSPFIPELTRATVRLTQWELRGVTWGMGGGIRFFVIPDETTSVDLFSPFSNLGGRLFFHPGGVPLSIDVSIDIRPGEFPNNINPRSNAPIPVAILATASFDAATVIASTVRFGATGTEAVPVQAALEDVNSDGRLDLLLNFNTQATGIQCQDTSASLTGQISSGQEIEGLDAITTVGCR